MLARLLVFILAFAVAPVALAQQEPTSKPAKASTGRKKKKKKSSSDATTSRQRGSRKKSRSEVPDPMPLIPTGQGTAAGPDSGSSTSTTGSEASAASSPAQPAGSTPEQGSTPPPSTASGSSPTTEGTPPTASSAPTTSPDPTASSSPTSPPGTSAPGGTPTPGGETAPGGSQPPSGESPPTQALTPQAPTTAPPATSAPEPTPTVTASAPPAEKEVLNFGLSVDAGVPDGVGASVVYRPFYFLRAHAGVTTNAASPGIRGGLSLIPFYFFITPALTVELGHQFEGNLNEALGRFGVDSGDNPLLRRFSYTYANAHLGLEIGSARRFIFFLRFGLSFLQTTVRNLNEINTVPGLTLADPTVRAGLPTLKLGFTLYIW